MDDPKRPSQAEGERNDADRPNATQHGRKRHPAEDDRTNDPPRPSQAEGEREAGGEHG